MTYSAFLDIKKEVDKFVDERGLKVEDIFMYAFPQAFADELTKKMKSKQVFVLLDKDNEFARVFVDGEFLYEVLGVPNNFSIDLNKRNISLVESDYF